MGHRPATLLTASAACVPSSALQRLQPALMTQRQHKQLVHLLVDWMMGQGVPCQSKQGLQQLELLLTAPRPAGQVPVAAFMHVCKQLI